MIIQAAALPGTSLDSSSHDALPTVVLRPRVSARSCPLACLEEPRISSSAPLLEATRCAGLRRALAQRPLFFLIGADRPDNRDVRGRGRPHARGGISSWQAAPDSRWPRCPTEVRDGRDRLHLLPA